MEWCEHKPKTPQVIREVNETAPRRVIAKVLTSNIGVKRHNVKESLRDQTKVEKCTGDEDDKFLPS